MTDETNPDVFLPFPELVASEPGAYEIIDSCGVEGLPTNGMTDKVNRVVWVPLEPGGRPVARHELAHVLWSPTRLPRVRGYPGYLQAVEDARINTGLARIGLPLELEPANLAQVVELGRNDLEHGSAGVIAWALRSVASFGTNVEAALLALADDETQPTLPFPEALTPGLMQRARDIVLETRRRLERARVRNGGDLASFEQGRRIARWLGRELRKLGLSEPRGGQLIACCLGEGALHEGEGRGAKGLRLPVRRRAHGGVVSGRMRVVTPRLVHPCAPVHLRRARGARAAAEGTELRYISRYVEDQKVWKRRIRRHRGGGSVLIDVSGSMSLDSEDVDRIIAAAPAATTVAIYSGRKHDGELRIVVHEGRRAAVEDLTPYGAGNVVDEPALQWLAKQPAPRVWVSDGGVTGRNDRSSPSIKRSCDRICKRSKIVRVRKSTEAAKALGATG